MNDVKKTFDTINKIVADWDPLGVGETIAVKLDFVFL